MDWRGSHEEIPPHLRRKWQEEESACRIYEEPAAFGLSISSAEELTSTEPESWETELTRLEGWLDESHFDSEGKVFP